MNFLPGYLIFGWLKPRLGWLKKNFKFLVGHTPAVTPPLRKTFTSRVQIVMNAQHGVFKFFVIFIVPWTILGDQKFFKIFWIDFGENRPFFLFPFSCQKLIFKKNLT
jgi:hypothetical protein